MSSGVKSDCLVTASLTNEFKPPNEAHTLANLTSWTEDSASLNLGEQQRLSTGSTAIPLADLTSHCPLLNPTEEGKRHPRSQRDPAVAHLLPHRTWLFTQRPKKTSGVLNEFCLYPLNRCCPIFGYLFFFFQVYWHVIDIQPCICLRCMA